MKTKNQSFKSVKKKRRAVTEKGKIYKFNSKKLIVKKKRSLNQENQIQVKNVDARVLPIKP